MTIYAPASLAQECFGDCNRDGTVTIDEAITAVSIALGRASIDECTAVDANRDGEITIDELVILVNRALFGCPIFVDLSVEMNPDPARPGDLVPVFFTIGNAGTFDLPAVVIEVEIPAEFASFLERRIIGNGDCSGNPCEAGELIVWSLGTLVPGSPVTVGMLPAVASGDAAPPDGTVIALTAVARSGDREIAATPGSIAVEAEPVLDLSLSSSPIEAGYLLTYTLHFGNRSVATFSPNAHLRMPLPAQTALIEASDGGVLVGDSVEWDLDDLLPGDGGTRHLTVRVNDALTDGSLLFGEASVQDGDANRAAASTTTRVERGALLHLSVELNPDPLRPGEQLEVVLTVTNTGLVDLPGVVVETILPPEFDAFARDLATEGLECVGGGRGTCEPGERAFWELGTLEAGRGLTVRMPPVLSADVPLGTVIRFDAIASDDSGANTLVRAGLYVDDEPVLDIALAAEASPVEGGDFLTYTLQFGNDSAATLSKNVRLRLPLPVGTAFVEAADGGELVGNTVEWDLKDLFPGDGGRRQLTVRMDESLLEGTLIAAEASVGDSDGNRSFARATTRVEIGLPIELSVELNPNPLRPGEQLEVVLTVTNTGLVNLPGVVVETALPPEFDAFNRDLATEGLECVGGLRPTCEPGERAFWDLGTLEAGEGLTVRMPPNLSGDVSPGTAIRFDACARDGSGANTRVQAGLVVDDEPGLTLVLAAEVSPVEGGDLLTYALHFGNDSETPSENVRLRMLVPVGTVFVAAGDGGMLTENTVEWDLGNLAQGDGGKRHLTVQVDEALAGGSLIAAEASALDADGNRRFSQTTTRVEEGLPIELSFELNPNPLQPSEQLEVVLTVTNTGLVNLPGVVVETALPPQFDAFARDLATEGLECVGGLRPTCDPGERAFWELGTLEAGSGLTVRMPPLLSADVPPGTVIRFDALARDFSGANIRLQAGLVVDDDRLLDLALAAEASPVEAGGMYDYTLDFGNPTSAASGSARLRIPIPRGVAFVQADDGGMLVDEGSAVEWQLGVLQAGDGGTRQFTVQVDAGLLDGSLLAAEASITDDSNRTTFAQTTTRVEGGVPLLLSAQLSPKPIGPGEQLEVTLTVTNMGPVDLPGVVVVTALPPEFDAFERDLATEGLECVGGPRPTCDPRERAFWELGSVQAGGEATVQMPPVLAAEVPPGTVIRFDAFVRDGEGTNSRSQAGLTVDAGNGL